MHSCSCAIPTHSITELKLTEVALQHQTLISELVTAMSSNMGPIVSGRICSVQVGYSYDPLLHCAIDCVLR